MLQILSGFPNDVLAVSATGRVTGEDYRTVLEPAVAEAVKRNKPLRLFYHLGPQLEAMEPGAFWEDGKVGVNHWRDWGRIAVVTDIAWIAGAVRLFAPLFRHPVRVFSDVEFEAARQWIADRDVEAA